MGRGAATKVLYGQVPGTGVRERAHSRKVKEDQLAAAKTAKRVTGVPKQRQRLFKWRDFLALQRSLKQGQLAGVAERYGLTLEELQALRGDAKHSPMPQRRFYALILKKLYPPDTTVKVDQQPQLASGGWRFIPEAGAIGKLIGIDDNPSFSVEFDNGERFVLLPNRDHFSFLSNA